MRQSVRTPRNRARWGLLAGAGLLASLALVGPAQADVVFHDRFDRGDASGWTGVGKAITASVAKGVARLTGDGVFYVPSTAGLSDYQIDADARNIQAIWGLGVGARITPLDATAAKGYGFSGYTFQYDFSAGGLRLVHFGLKHNDQSIVPNVTTPIDGNWHHLALRVQGNRLTAGLDGQQVFDATDVRYTAGAAGLRVWRGRTLDYKNVVVTSLAPAPAPTYVVSVGDASARGWGA